MRSFHGFHEAILDVLPDAPPGLPVQGIREILRVRSVRAPNVRTIHADLLDLHREGLVHVARKKRPGRWWRA